MNYFDKHIGDYIRDTVSLTMLEDGAYNRLIDQVYQTERALPKDRKEVYRLARATSTLERKAVDYVLEKFFHVTEDGYMQKRAQAVIEAYWDREPAQESKRENTRIRQQRTRERRKSLFDQLRDLGVTPAFNASMKVLEAELSRVTKPEQSQSGHATVTRDDTLTQTPDTTSQTPDLKAEADDDSTDSGGAESVSKPDPDLPPAADDYAAPRSAPLPTRELPPVSSDPAVQLMVALRRLGVNVLSTNPHLLQWVADGATLAQLTEAVGVARETKGDSTKIPPGYLVPIVEKIRNPPALAEAKAPKPATDTWWLSNQGIERKGKELGMFARGSESYNDFKDRIFATIRKQGGKP